VLQRAPKKGRWSSNLALIQGYFLKIKAIHCAPVAIVKVGDSESSIADKNQLLCFFFGGKTTRYFFLLVSHTKTSTNP
jgi:hypothetical protein